MYLVLVDAMDRSNIIDFDDMKSTEIEQIFYHKLGHEVFVYIKVNYCAIKKDLHPPMSIELSATFSRKYGTASFPDWTIDTGHFFNTSQIQDLVFKGIVKGQESKVWAFFKGLRSFRGPQKQN